ncbi:MULTISPECIES: hypothetical protein [unclassified Mesorhizobium]|uniref:hypothetical protein n=1 Tax=unclassified Mesorhizobium TaxID=325217 RepID=UPI0032AEEAFF
MSEITPSRKTGRPKGYIANYQPQTKTLALLDAVDMVLTEYREHWPLTIRHVFYRLVGAYGYPKDESFYSKLIDHIGNARRGRVIPFNAIRDDGVVTHRMDHFDDQNHFLRHVRCSAKTTIGTCSPIKTSTSRSGARPAACCRSSSRSAENSRCKRIPQAASTVSPRRRIWPIEYARSQSRR